eukprot:sb/3466293/
MKESVQETLRLIRRLQNEPHQSGYRGFTDYYPGSNESRIIIAAPHGGIILCIIKLQSSSSKTGFILSPGNLRPDYIRDRRKNCCGIDTCPSLSPSNSVTLVRDAFTLEMAVTLRDELSVLLGERPHLILCHLNRRKVDVNRPLEVAAQHNPHAEQAWHDYHRFIGKARAHVSRVVGRGILFDIHGQSHPEKLIELGYRLTVDHLNTFPLSHDSTIRSAVQHSKHSFENILRGPQSLGARLSKEGYAAVPSPTHRCPPGNYFHGGYTVQRWGSQRGGCIDAIQMEMPLQIRKNYAKDGMVIASVLADFITDLYILNCRVPLLPHSEDGGIQCLPKFFWELVHRLFYV